MKEITRITTIEITHVVNVEDEVVDRMEQDAGKYEVSVADALRIEADADDVHVHVQLFIAEVPDADSN